MWKKIHDRVSLSKKLSKLSYTAFRVWFFVLPNSDIKGRYSADPELIKAQCMPRVDVRLEQIAEALAELAEQRLIHLFDVGSERYFVYHDHTEHNPGGLKYQKSKWPNPPSDLCPCVTANGDTNAVSNGVSLSQSDSQSESSSPDRSDPAGILATAYCNKNKGIISFEKCKAICDFHLAGGATFKEAETAIWNSSKGQKIWEILDPLRDKLRKSPVDGKSFRQIETVCHNCGGSGQTVAGPCPGCKKGREFRRAQA